MLDILFGFIAGTISGLGMGGGTILILLLSLFLNVNQHVAQATNLVFFIPTSVAAILMNLKYKKINFKVATIVILFGIIGAVLGALISSNIDSSLLKKIFGMFILIIGIKEIIVLYKEYKNKRKSNNNIK